MFTTAKRDGISVLPTGRNIHALDPYRMPSAGAWAKGQRAVDEIIRQHRNANSGDYPETVAVTLWVRFVSYILVQLVLNTISTF